MTNINMAVKEIWKFEWGGGGGGLYVHREAKQWCKRQNPTLIYPK